MAVTVLRLACSVYVSVTDHVLQEHFENAMSLLVDQTTDTLHTIRASQTTDGWLHDTLDIIMKYFAMTFGQDLCLLPPLPRPDILARVLQILHLYYNIKLEQADYTGNTVIKQMALSQFRCIL